VAKNKSQVFPIIVSGKVTYIKIEDIQTSDKLLKLQSATDRMKNKATQKSTDKKIAFVSSAYVTSMSVEESYVGDTTRSATFTGYGLRGYMHNLINGNGWRFSLNSITFIDDSESLSIAEIQTDYFVDLIQSGGFDFSGFVGVIIVPYAEYKVDSQFTENGYGLGFGIGTEATLKLGSTVSFHFDGSYQYTKLAGFDLPSSIGVDNFNPVLNGMKFTAAIAFSY